MVRTRANARLVHSASTKTQNNPNNSQNNPNRGLGEGQSQWV